jgi:hypothetical protein
MIERSMAKKKDLLTREEKDSCLKFVSGNNNKSVQEQVSKLLDEMQISLDEPIVEDSIDGTRIRVTYTIALSRKGGGIDEDAIRFQYIKEIPVDYSNIPVKIRDSTIGAAAASAVDNTLSHNNNNNNSTSEDTIIESYDELENSIPTLCEVLGLLKKIYFMPEDFSNRLVVDRIHKLRNMFSKDEILTFPSIDLSDKAGLIPI